MLGFLNSREWSCLPHWLVHTITVIRCDCVYLTYFILSFNIQAVIDTLTTWTLFFNPSHILSFCFFFFLNVKNGSPINSFLVHMN